jgi:hypothetical protein
MGQSVRTPLWDSFSLDATLRQFLHFLLLFCKGHVFKVTTEFIASLSHDGYCVEEFFV